jgi:predicted transcriptional regulator
VHCCRSNLLIQRTAKTAGIVTTAIQSLASSDVPANVENLSVEFRHTYDAVQRLKALAEEPHRFQGRETLCQEAREVVADTQKTLTELRQRIDKLQPPEKSKGKFRALQMRTRYQWSERSIHILLLRLQARRSALSSLLESFARSVLQPGLLLVLTIS